MAALIALSDSHGMTEYPSKTVMDFGNPFPPPIEIPCWCVIILMPSGAKGTKVRDKKTEISTHKKERNTSQVEFRGVATNGPCG
jgi:hypothetical protein